VDFIQWCMLDGIEVATVYAFSTENWNRDPSEINTLMSIFAKYAESLTTEASTKNVRVRILSTGRLLLSNASHLSECVKCDKQSFNLILHTNIMS
jgi:undecaprenyl diphosphate synthase